MGNRDRPHAKGRAGKVRSTMTKRNIPELLSPAGGMEQVRAAVQNGADAVYMGGPLFNARIKAENFNRGDMIEAINYAHRRNVKIYVTLNTLIKDSELYEAFSYANFLYGAGADAVILQDLGLARLIKKYLPDLPMHLSTQGTVYNKWAVDTAKNLGFCRIVPARELSLEEIEEFSTECHRGDFPCEVEVFVHGALCMCYSGQCQMSKALGGNNARSGNRGMCAQPCRLAYGDDTGKKSFLLSPKDICTVENIPELCEAGIDSFKIEGRLKSPQYVAVVTRIYRKYLDMYRDEGYVEVQAEDTEELLQIFNRGGFGRGYLFGNPGRKLLSGDSPKNRGLYMGKVRHVKKGSTLIDVECSESISIGDGVEIHSREVTGNVISYLKELPGGLLRLGDIKGRVAVGDKVYKVTDKELLKKAEATYAEDRQRRVPVSMKFTAEVGRPAQLELWEVGQKDRLQVKAASEFVVEKARTKATDSRRVAEQLARLGDTPFKEEDMEIHVEEEALIPISVINRLRREAAQGLAALKIEMGRTVLTGDRLEAIRQDEKLGVEKLEPKGEGGLYIYSRQTFSRITAHPYDVASEPGLPGKMPQRIYVPLELFMERCRDERPENVEQDGSEVIPYILNASRGNLDRYIEENFRDIVTKVMTTGIMIGNLGWIDRFLEAGVPVYGDYGLNVYNRQSERVFEEMSVEIRTYSHEAEMFFCGNIPLMITEHPILSDILVDRKNKKYTILRWHSGDKYLIFSGDAKGAGKDKTDDIALHFRDSGKIKPQVNYIL